MSYYVVLT